MENRWIVVWSNGKILTFVPYDSMGMTSFIRRGLEEGPVTVNDKEVYIDDTGFWQYKDSGT